VQHMWLTCVLVLRLFVEDMLLKELLLLIVFTLWYMAATLFRTALPAMLHNYIIPHFACLGIVSSCQPQLKKQES